MKLPDFKNMSAQRRNIYAAVLIAAVILICVLLYVACRPLIAFMEDEQTKAQFTEWVESLGAWGIAALLATQILQIVIAFIPGELVQVLAGTMYGVWGGLAICLFGCVVASSIIFLLIRKLGVALVERVIGKDELDKYSFFQDSAKLETLVFILFLIPGLPKDTFTYIVPLTRIRFATFIFLSTIGRIPGMVASTLIGSSITDANWLLIITIFVVVIIIAGIGIWKKDALMSWAKSMGGIKHQSESH